MLLRSAEAGTLGVKEQIFWNFYRHWKLKLTSDIISDEQVQKQNSLKFPLIALKMQIVWLLWLRVRITWPLLKLKYYNATEIQKVLQFMKHLLKAF
jgi:hypothetical protein